MPSCFYMSGRQYIEELVMKEEKERRVENEERLENGGGR